MGEPGYEATYFSQNCAGIICKGLVLSIRALAWEGLHVLSVWMCTIVLPLKLYTTLIYMHTVFSYICFSFSPLVSFHLLLSSLLPTTPSAPFSRCLNYPPFLPLPPGPLCQVVPWYYGNHQWHSPRCWLQLLCHSGPVRLRDTEHQVNTRISV